MIPRRLEIAASARVLATRRLAAVEQCGAGAVLGREERTLRQLAEDCAAETGEVRAADLDGIALERLVEHVARASPHWSEAIAQRPGLARGLAATLRDLRDAGVAPEALPGGSRGLADLLAGLEAALAKLAERGHLDRIGLFRRARRGAPAWLERLGIREIDVHGATELVGSAGDLIDTLSHCVPLRFYQPDWGSDYAQALRDDWPWSFRPEPVEVVADPFLAPGGELGAEDARLFVAPSRRAELEACADEVLARLEGGADPTSIWVVARSLEPYASWIDAVFGARGIPISTSHSEAVARQPAARAWIDLLGALGSNLEHKAVLQLLRSPRTKLGVRRPGTAIAHAAWLARRAAVLRGRDDWSSALDDAARLAKQDRRSHDPGDSEPIRDLIGELDRARTRLIRARDLRTAAQALLRTGRELLHEPADDAEREADLAMRDALAAASTLDRVDRAAGATAPTGEELAPLLRSLLEAPRARAGTDTPGGVNVVDALQARGVETPHLLLVGLEYGAWPRPRREDPHLPDEPRAALRRATGRPVPVGTLADAEEPFLLGLLLSQTRNPLWLCRAEHDPQGRELTPSPLLRSLPFVAPHSGLLDTEQPAPALGEGRYASARSALVGIALHGDLDGEPELFVAAARDTCPEDLDALVAGHSYVRATEDLDGHDLRFDAAVGPADSSESEARSPSFLDTLGKCPLRAFFSRVLRVPESDARPAWSLEARESGQVFHDILAHLYTHLWESGALAAGTKVEAALASAQRYLPEAIEAAAGALRTGLRERNPTLWHSLVRQIRAAIEDLLARDLPGLLEAGAKRIEIEFDLDCELPDCGLRVAGRVDRLVETARGWSVVDWKRRADAKSFTSASAMRRGRALQIPLYLLMAAGHFDTSEVSGRAVAVPPRPERDRKDERTGGKDLALGQAREATAEPLRVLGGLLRSGHFPFREDAQDCGHCDYAIACRRAHSASARRVEASPAHAPYFELQDARS